MKSLKNVNLRDKILFFIAISAFITDMILICNVIHHW